MAIDKIANPALVANAYSTTQKSGEGPGINFADLIGAGVKSAVSDVKGAETASAKAVAGKADLNDVIQSISKAELTIQTVVAIRDRLVSAYQEILRMPI